MLTILAVLISAICFRSAVKLTHYVFFELSGLLLFTEGLDIRVNQSQLYVYRGRVYSRDSLQVHEFLPH